MLANLKYTTFEEFFEVRYSLTIQSFNLSQCKSGYAIHFQKLPNCNEKHYSLFSVLKTSLPVWPECFLHSVAIVFQINQVF